MMAFVKSIPILVIAFVTLIIDDASLVRSIPALYFAAFAWTLIATFDKREGSLAYFRPSSLMSAYVCFFFAMGSFAFSNGWVLDVVDQRDYYRLPYLRHATFFFLCATWVTFLSRCLAVQADSAIVTRDVRNAVIERYRNRSLNFRQIGLSLFIAAFSLCVDIRIPGGEGSFSSCFFMFAAYHISYVCNVKRLRSRFLVYLALCGIIAIFFYGDRRLVAFYAFTVCFIEFYSQTRIKIRLRSIITSAGVIGAVVVLVLAMSIQRGVGQFGTKSVVESLSYVDDYLRSDWAKTMLFHNFEGPATTFHSYNATDYIMATGDYAYGSTIAKTLFLPIPRSICAWKPRSLVDDYTTHFYPRMRADGVSFVPNFFAEAFWNFGFIGGLLFLLATFALLNSIYDRALRRYGRDAAQDALFLSSHSFLLFFFRGCGLELYVLFVLIFFAISVLYKLASAVGAMSPTPEGYATQQPR